MVDVGSASAKLCMQSAIYAGIVVTSARYSENCRQPMLLQPVCIYGCFALLGLISAVHSQIPQYSSMPCFLSHGLCIVPMPDEAHDRQNIVLVE